MRVLRSLLLLLPALAGEKGAGGGRHRGPDLPMSLKRRDEKGGTVQKELHHPTCRTNPSLGSCGGVELASGRGHRQGYFLGRTAADLATHLRPTTVHPPKPSACFSVAVPHVAMSGKVTQSASRSGSEVVQSAVRQGRVQAGPCWPCACLLSATHCLHYTVGTCSSLVDGWSALQLCSEQDDGSTSLKTWHRSY